MRNLIPHFISEKLIQRIHSGSDDFIVMFLDIPGFTSMTEHLMHEEEQGAECLSKILNNVFSPVISCIYEKGGFVSVFAGDAFTALFNHAEYQNALDCALKIREIFADHGKQVTELGTFELSVELGIASGRVDWGIVQANSFLSYYFKGEAIQKSILCERKSKSMGIIVDQEMAEKSCSFANFHKLDTSFYTLIGLNNTNSRKLSNTRSTLISKKVLKQFVPSLLLDKVDKGEFRNIVSLFLGFNEHASHENFERFFADIMNATRQAGGYFNKIDFGDKGPTIVIFFGAPVTYENNTQKALNLALQIKQRHGKAIKAGMSTGLAYAGFVGGIERAEYTCLGDLVNIAARFMKKAEWGEILISEKLQKSFKSKYETRPLGNKIFRGISRFINVYELLSLKANTFSPHFHGSLLDRDKELAEMNTFLQIADSAKIIYIYGEAGIGKSRLVYESLKNQEALTKLCTLDVDPHMKTALSPFIVFLQSYFHRQTEQSDADFEQQFETIYEDIRQKLEHSKSNEAPNILAKFVKTKSILGALLGLHWDNSFYEALDAQLKHRNTGMAISTFFQALSLMNPVILLIENLHWMESETEKFFCSLISDLFPYRVKIIVCSRLYDNGTRPVLDRGSKEEKREIVLHPLSHTAAKLLVKNILGKEADKSLYAFIRAKTNGNPFFIEQFCLYLQDSELLTDKRGQLTLLSRQNVIPGKIQDILIARIDRLSTDLKETIQTAAILGREIDINILFKLTRLIDKQHSELEFQSLISKIAEEQVWYKLFEARYIFRNVLMYEAVYSMQLKQRVIHLHAHAAAVLEELYADKDIYAAEIAYHYDKAELFSKAEKYYEKAALFFKSTYQNHEALQQFDCLLAITDDKKKIIGALQNKALILQLKGNWEQSKTICMKSISLSSEYNMPLLKASGMCQLAWLFSKQGNYDSAMSTLKEVLSLSQKFTSKAIYIEALNKLGTVHFYLANYDQAMSIFNETAERCLEAKDRKTYAKIQGSIGLVYARQGNYIKAMEHYDAYRNISVELDDRLGLSAALGNMGLAYSHQRDFKQALDCYRQYRDLSLELGNRSGYSNAECCMGNLYWQQGEYGMALESYEEYKQISLELGDRKAWAVAVGNIGEVYFMQGAYQKALECYQKKGSVSEEIGDKKGLSIALGNMAKTESMLNHNDLARKYFLKAIKLAKALKIQYFLCDHLYHFAGFLYKCGKERKAEKINKEALQLSYITGRHEHIISTRILKYRITQESQGLREMLEQNNLDDEQRADIYYELFMLDKNVFHRNKAKALYKQLLGSKQNNKFLLRLENLSKCLEACEASCRGKENRV